MCNNLSAGEGEWFYKGKHPSPRSVLTKNDFSLAATGLFLKESI